MNNSSLARKQSEAAINEVICDNDKIILLQQVAAFI